MDDFLHLEDAARRLGLEMNRSKCEVVGHTKKTRTLFATHNVTLPETSPSTVVLLGAPLSAGEHLDTVLDKKKQELSLLTKRLELMPAHDSLYLSNVSAMYCAMYRQPGLAAVRYLIQECLSTILNVDLDDDRWCQASLVRGQ